MSSSENLEEKLTLSAEVFLAKPFQQQGNDWALRTLEVLCSSIARATKQIQPQYLFLENVKGLLNHDGGGTFRTILSTLDELGYDAEWQVLNSKDFGVPQNRERVFIIGHLRGAGGREVFPIRESNGEFSQELRKIEVVGTTQPEHSTSLGHRHRVFSSGGLIGAITATTYKQPQQVLVPSSEVAFPVSAQTRGSKVQNGRRIEGNQEPMFTLTGQDRHGILVVGNLPGKHVRTTKVYDDLGISPTLLSMQGGGTVPKILQKPRGYNKGGEHELSPTLSSNSWHKNNFLGVSDIANNYRIRQLTPRECWRLQGFPDEVFEKAQEVNSNTQLYKQAGNSVTVNVIKIIAERLT